MNKRFDILKGIHPGKFLERELIRKGINKNTFAASVSEHPQTISAITKGKRSLTVRLALRAERELNLEEGFLSYLQTAYDIELIKKGDSSKPDLSLFRPSLFWDTDIQKLDWMKHKKSILQRINNYGNLEEKKAIDQFYSIPYRKEVIINENK